MCFQGKTVELRGAGDTKEDIFRVVIPKNSLRVMTEPDLFEDEPDKGVNVLVLYASNHAVDYTPLLQTCIECDPEIIARGKEDKVCIYIIDLSSHLYNEPKSFSFCCTYIVYIK